jgi:hypothetical protein
LFELGDRRSVEETLGELSQLAERTRDAFISVAARAPISYLTFVDGHLERAIELETELQAEARERGLAGGNSAAVAEVVRDAIAFYPSRSMFYLGQTLPVGPDDPLPMGRPQLAFRALNLARGGHFEAAQAIVSRFGDIASDADDSGSHVLLASMETALLSGNSQLALALARRFEPLAGQLHFPMAVTIGRLCGEASVMANDWSSARRFYDEALVVSQKVRFRPETALVRLDLAELLLDHYSDEHDAAIEHLDFAIADLRDMKMQPALERALRRRGLLKA